MLTLIAKAFIWDELTFPSPTSPSPGLQYLLCPLQLLISLVKLIYWRLFIFRLVFRLVGSYRRAFGRFLVAFAAVGISSVVASIYICLLPLRIARWHGSLSNSELYWLFLHALAGNLVLANIVFHFLSGVVLSPGCVPPFEPLPPNLPRTMCSRCLRPRPQRAHHCAVCGVCVLRMDHHCPWFNNCVGLRTHRHFFLFLLHLAVGIGYLYVAALRDFVEHSRQVCEDDTPFNCFIHSIVCALYRVSLLVFLFALSLILWHGRLISRGETSIEYYQNQKLVRRLHRYHLVYRNPFDFGPHTNWLRFLGLEVPTDPRVMKKKNAGLGFGTYLKRFVAFVLLPIRCPPYDGDGMKFETCEPDLESALKDLNDLE